MKKTLYVFLFDELVGRLTQERAKLNFIYDETWLASSNACALSVALPLQVDSFNDTAANAFFAGLLPEGSLRKLLLRQFQLSEANAFGLLNEIGGECAGAVSLHTTPELPQTHSTGLIQWLDDDELAKILVELPQRPMLAGSTDMRLSLAGAQDKLPVVVDDQRIGLALQGEPSTHILKPAINSLSETVLNEAFCLQLAATAGLEAAHVQIGTVNDSSYLLVKRYDRTSDAQGLRHRLHQEDFCQALGRTSDSKYQHEGGPDLTDCLQLIREQTRPNAPNVLRFIDYIFFNALIGNHDAHAKNFSLLYMQAPTAAQHWKPTLAPLYDSLCTAAYPQLSKKMAMKIASQYTFKGVMPRHWQQFARSNRLAVAPLQKRLLHFAQRLPALADALRNKHSHFQSSTIVNTIVALIEERSESTLRRFERHAR
ncbi:MAG: type II toxin-antitoxin system HipA family toxin [Granulosicoccus sp.]